METTQLLRNNFEKEKRGELAVENTRNRKNEDLFPRDVLEGKSEKTKLAWPKNAQPKMPCSFFHSKMKVSQWSIAFNGRWFRGDLSEMLACLSARLRNGPNVTVTS